MSRAVMLSTVCLVWMWEGIRLYACMRPSSSVRSEDSSPVRMVILPHRDIVSVMRSMNTPNVELGVAVPAPRTEPSDAL